MVSFSHNQTVRSLTCFAPTKPRGIRCRSLFRKNRRVPDKEQEHSNTLKLSDGSPLTSSPLQNAVQCITCDWTTAASIFGSYYYHIKLSPRKRWRMATENGILLPILEEP